MKTITLRPGKERSLLRGHPWVFQGTAELALPGRQCRPLGGDAAGGAGGDNSVL